MKFLKLTLLICSLVISFVLLNDLLKEIVRPQTSVANSFDDSWSSHPNSRDIPEIEKALEQHYTYLDKGSQCFAYISDDKKYILKFIRTFRWETSEFLKNTTLPSSLEKLKLKRIKKKQEGRFATFYSCLLSFNEIKEDTKLLYLHLNQTIHHKGFLHVKNRLGIEHQIPINTSSFILQRRADSLVKHFKQLKKTNQKKQALDLIRSFLIYSENLAKRGLSDKDPNFLKNFGLINNKIVQIDIGGITKDPKKDLSYFYTKELNLIQKELLKDIKVLFPELQDKIISLIADFKKRQGTATRTP